MITRLVSDTSIGVAVRFYLFVALAVFTVTSGVGMFGRDLQLIVIPVFPVFTTWTGMAFVATFANYLARTWP